MSQESNAWIVAKLRADAAIVTLMGGSPNEITIAEPEERPALLSSHPAIVVLRTESETPETENSQGGVRYETIYIEARSWSKQTVHDLKARIVAVLGDVQGVLPAGGSVYRVRYDWNKGPYLNPDGRTWENQARFIVWYR